jgi:hypothetical protein
MRREPPGCPHLILPRKTSSTVSGELYIIRRIGIHKIFRFQLERLDILVTKLPLPEHARVTRKLFRVVDLRIRSEGDIEIPALIKTTKTIETRTVKVIEQLRGFLAVCFTLSNQTVESIALAIKERLVVSHLHAHSQTILQLTVKIYQMWIDVIQQRKLWLQPKHNGETAAKWLHVSSLYVRFPNWFDMRDEPTLAAGPFQRRLEHHGFLNGGSFRKSEAL